MDCVRVTIMIEDYIPYVGGDWVMIEFETEYYKIVTQDENELIDYLFGLVLGDGIECTGRSYIILIDKTDGSSYTRWKLL